MHGMNEVVSNTSKRMELYIIIVGTTKQNDSQVWLSSESVLYIYYQVYYQWEHKFSPGCLTQLYTHTAF